MKSSKLIWMMTALATISCASDHPESTVASNSEKPTHLKLSTTELSTGSIQDWNGAVELKLVLKVCVAGNYYESCNLLPKQFPVFEMPKNSILGLQRSVEMPFEQIVQAFKQTKNSANKEMELKIEMWETDGILSQHIRNKYINLSKGNLGTQEISVMDDAVEKGEGTANTYVDLVLDLN